MPSVTAKRRCPDLIFVKPRFDIYMAVSLQIRDYQVTLKVKSAVPQVNPQLSRQVVR